MNEVKAADVRNKLVSEVADLTESDFNKKLDEQTWSIGQICEHLSKMDSQVLLTIRYTMNKVEKEAAPQKPIEMALDRGTKIEAPEIVTPGSGPYQKKEIVAALQESKNELDQALADIEEKELQERSSRHPVFGRLSLMQWVELRAYHELRHIEQIQEIKNELT